MVCVVAPHLSVHSSPIIILVALALIISPVSAAPADAVSLPGESTSSVSGYAPPEGSFPVIYLSGDEREMGFQYGSGAAREIAEVRDGVRATLVLKYNMTIVQANLKTIDGYLRNNVTAFAYPEFIQGIVEGAATRGIEVSYEDLLLIASMYSLESLPTVSTPSACTSFAAWGDATLGGGLVVGSTYDYHRGLVNAYEVLVVAYPKSGHAFVSPTLPGRLSNNFQMNDQGVVRVVNKGPTSRKEDRAFRVTDFVIGPAVAVSCGSAAEAKDLILATPQSGGTVHLVADPTGAAYVIERTASLSAVRSARDHGEEDYLLAANHYLEPVMAPAQVPWDPLTFYPSSYYRYITAQRLISGERGEFGPGEALAVLSSTEYWDGTRYVAGKEWEGLTINRFLPDGGTLESKVALPGEGVLWICGGNPGHPEWNRFVPGGIGEFVRFDLKDTPQNTTLALKQNADAEIFSTARVLAEVGKRDYHVYRGLMREWEGVMDEYLRAEHDMSTALVTLNRTAALAGFGEASTGYMKVQGESLSLRRAAVEAINQAARPMLPVFSPARAAYGIA